MPQTRQTVLTAVASCRAPLLSFTPVTAESIPAIQRILPKSGSRSCDYTVGGIIMWANLFDYQYCIIQNTLFIKSLSEDGSGRTAFLVPVGDMPVQRKIELLRSYCRYNDIPLLFTAVPEDIIDSLRPFSPSAITELTDWADYIYDASALANLTGKAYNKKRNHVNRFIADNPGYKLEKITEDNRSELQSFFNGLGIESAKADPEMAEFEWGCCSDAIDRFGEYGFTGALLRQGDGRIAAFTMGEITGDTLVLHIEKIEHLVPGAGEAINKFFAEKMLAQHPSLRYINREDDAGDPGLRQAKLSYHPAFMLRKFNVEFV